MDIISEIRQLMQQENPTPEVMQAFHTILDLWEHRESMQESAYAYRDKALRSREVLTASEMHKKPSTPVQFAVALATLELQDYYAAHDIFEGIPARYRLPNYDKICDFHLSFPVGITCFAELVPQMWECFRHREEDLIPCYNRTWRGSAVDVHAPIFRPILNNLNIYCARHAGYDKKTYTYELRFGIGNHPEDLIPLIYMVEHAPSDLRHVWDFHASIERMPSQRVQINGVDLGLRDFKYQEGFEDAYYYHPIKLYHPELTKLAKKDPAAAGSMARFLVNCAAGELLSYAFYDPVKIADTSPGVFSPSLFNLPYSNTLERKNKLTPRGYFRETYTTLHEFSPISGLRSDIKQGSTLFSNLLKEYQRHESDIFCSLARIGVAAGFVFFPAELSQETGPDYFWRLLWQITDLADGEIFPTGFAVGTQYLYIDFLAFDFLKVMDALKQVFFSMEGGEEAMFASFYPGATPTSLVSQQAIDDYRACLA